MSQEIVITDEYKRVIELIKAKSPLVFINGKAGTGKSTLINLLKKLFDEAETNVAFVAPTGIAALNIEGQTIHSFFKLPARILLPHELHTPRETEIYKKLDVLVIDEAGMPRADNIDTINKFLQKVRKNRSPFGGVRIMLIGDLFQLPPVVTDGDALVLAKLGYPEGEYYFFDSKIIKACRIEPVELTSVFRQADKSFVNLLSHVRVGERLDEAVRYLNKKCFGRVKNPLAIELVTTNALADKTNTVNLNAIKTPSRTYLGKRTEGFVLNGRNLPSPEELVLKVGAKVMFTANGNDSEGECWSNGTLGTVEEMPDGAIVRVKLQNGITVDVTRKEWKSYEYYTSASGRIEQREAGSYTQIPLTLAWAITIHKSQGQSLEHLHVNMGRGAFATGQAYVALSRARSLEGMTFEYPLKERDIMCCPRVKAFIQNLNQTANSRPSNIMNG